MKKVLVSCLTAVFIIILMFSFVQAEISDGNAGPEDAYLEKISDDVFTSPLNENGERTVIVFRELPTEDQIDSAFFEKHGYHTDLYEKEDEYRSVVVPRVTDETFKKYGKDVSVSLEEGKKRYDDNTTILQQELLSDFQNYVKERRTVIREIIGKDTDLFIERNKIDRNKTSYIGDYTGSVILDATDDKIYSLARDKSVQGISWFNNAVQESHICDSPAIIGTDSNTGTGSSYYNNGNGYKGTDIKVGVIEAEKYIYNSGNIMLRSNGSAWKYRYDYVDWLPGEDFDGVVNEHTTYVCSTIVGQPTEYNGKTYSGVVPNANLVQIPIIDTKQLVEAYNFIISEWDLSVVNYSGGYLFDEDNEYYYSTVDREIDRWISSTGVTLVTTAGNCEDTIGGTVYVPSPGSAFNAITVGSVKIKNQDGSAVAPFVLGVSSVREDSYNKMINKPDVAAPGEYIEYLVNSIAYNPSYPNNNIGISRKPVTGTSFAAPMVTGIVAQLQQANPFLLNKPEMIKSIICLGASNQYLDLSSNEGITTPRYGTGLVNSERSVQSAERENYFRYEFNLYTVSAGANRTETIHLSQGQKIRVACTFAKPFNDNEILYNTGLASMPVYGNNIDIQLLGPSLNDPSLHVVASSMSPDNNVELIEYTADTSGTFIIKTILTAKKTVTENTWLNVGVSYLIEGTSPEDIVYFNYNGGIQGIPYKYVEYGDLYGNLPVPVHPNGYVFGGWWFTQTAEGVEVKSSTNVMTSNAHTLYAHWLRPYSIVNVGANKNLNVYGDNVTSLYEGQNLTLWSGSGTNEQKFYLSSLSNQVYVRSVIDKTFGLNVYTAGSPYNCNMHSIIGNENDAQVDIILVNNKYRIKLHNYNLYMTAGSSYNGANVYWTSYSDSDYQCWYISLTS